MARSMPWELPCWTLPETTYLSSDGFGGEGSGVQYRSPGTQVNVEPRQLRKKANDKSVSEIFNQRLLSRVGSQIAQWLDGHGNARKQAWPLCLRFLRFSRSLRGFPW